MFNFKSNEYFQPTFSFFYKKTLFIACFFFISPQSLAHSGRTNSQGCHAGSQPYHCHGGGSYGSSSYGSSGSHTSNVQNNDAQLREEIKMATYSPNKKNYSDDEIRLLLIKKSISKHTGNCPCPYFTDQDGNRCGMGSAWSQPRESGLLCYKSDVSQEMVQKARTQGLKVSI